MPNFTRARWAFEAKNALREILRARLALAVYKAAHGGTYPATLEGLVESGAVSRVPSDPFSVNASEPLRYDAKTGKVWSVGENGIDEKGGGDDDLQPY